MAPRLSQRIVGEAVGTAFLLAAIVGSGIMAERLAGGNAALALLANAIATGGALIALILTFAPISGAHFNPIVTLILARETALSPRAVCLYLTAQFIGAIAGVFCAHAMFGLPLLEVATHGRASAGEWFGEFVATFGLVGLILSSRRHAPATIPYGVAAFIVGAYWFTASTSFANPAVALARALTNTFAGIRPDGVLAFMVAEIAGAVAARVVFGWLLADGAASKETA